VELDSEEQEVMKFGKRTFGRSRIILVGAILISAITSVFGQVSPDEILNPRAKADEEKYILQLQSLHQSISAAKFASPFRLARYVNAKPGQQGASDSSGLEFVYFQDRVVLKISGVYSGVFNAGKVSRNQRAGQTFQEAVVPVLRLVAQQIPPTADFDAIGFEIIYGTRENSDSFDLEGKESLTVIFNRNDAFSYAKTSEIAARQKILNRSDIFVNGEDFGLALGQRDPLIVESLGRFALRQAEEASASTKSNSPPVEEISGASLSPAVSSTRSMNKAPDPPTFADAMRLQNQFQAQLSAIATEYGASLHFASKTPPSFEVAGDQTLLHFTMRNTLSFDRTTTSIYKRAAQSFDLFLAPELRSLSRKLPDNQEYAVQFSVLNPSATDQASVETIDYICPLTTLDAFVTDKITSQDLINQSVVLVNGVRIAVNLQLVE
jgi:hypothetical protein